MLCSARNNSGNLNVLNQHIQLQVIKRNWTYFNSWKDSIFNIKIYTQSLRGEEDTQVKAVASALCSLHFTLNNFPLTIISARPPIDHLSLWLESSAVNLIRHYSITFVREKKYILSLSARVIIIKWRKG